MIMKNIKKRLTNIIGKIYLVLLIILPITSLADDETKVLVLGDSLSASYGFAKEEGWVELLQVDFDNSNRNITIINSSISGETSSGGLRRLPSLLSEVNPNIVIIELGGNDGLRATNLDILESNLTRMVNMSKENNAKVLLLGVEIPPNYGIRYTNAFSQVYKNVVETTELEAFIPFFIEDVVLNPELMQSDGIHPNAMAQQKILEIVKPILLSLVE